MGESGEHVFRRNQRSASIERVDTKLLPAVEPLERLKPNEDEEFIFDELKALLQENVKEYKITGTLPEMTLVFAREGLMKVGGVEQKLTGGSPWSSPEILISSDVRKDPKYLRHILGHEMWHKIGNQPLTIAHSAKGTFAIMQTGLHRQYINVGTREQARVFFWGLNEAIVEQANIDMLREEVADYQTYEAYGGPRMILRRIVDVLAQGDIRKHDLVFQDLVKAYKENDYSMLKRTEDAFGPGTVKILSSMTPDISLEEYEYFSSSTLPERRQELRELLLAKPIQAIPVLEARSPL